MWRAVSNSQPRKPLGSKLGLQVSQKLTRAQKLVQRVKDGYVLPGGQDTKGLQAGGPVWTEQGGRQQCVASGQTTV